MILPIMSIFASYNINYGKPPQVKLMVIKSDLESEFLKNFFN